MRGRRSSATPPEEAATRDEVAALREEVARLREGTAVEDDDSLETSEHVSLR
jgi:hypothetical protein